MIFKAHRLYFVSISGALQYARFILFMVHKRGKQVSKEKSFCNENWLAIEFCTSAVISNSQKDCWMKKKKSCQTHLKKLFCVVPLSMILIMMLMMLLMMLMTQDVGWLLKWRAMGTDATSWRHLPTNHIDQQTSSNLSYWPTNIFHQTNQSLGNHHQIGDVSSSCGERESCIFIVFM